MMGVLRLSEKCGGRFAKCGDLLDLWSETAHTALAGDPDLNTPLLPYQTVLQYVQRNPLMVGTAMISSVDCEGPFLSSTYRHPGLPAALR
jgi:hypothetical protein